MQNLRIGLIINPYAGIGGSVALKGSDGRLTREKAFALGAKPQANKRTQVALSVLLPYQQALTFYTASGEMGEHCLAELGFNYQVIYSAAHSPTEAEDTELCIVELLKQDLDLILFAGGDGTARNIYNQIDDKTPVLGIPAGCKIHSGVYSLTPKSAGLLIEKLIQGQLLSLAEADVMDINEDLFRQGQVKAKRYGEMQIPMDLRYVQAVKMGGKESEELILADIAADIIENMGDELYLIGSGSTTQVVMDELGLPNTLLGVDAICEQTLIANDLSEQAIIELLNQYSKVKLVITLIGGQGHLFGRGNQQLSPKVIRLIGRENIIVIATKSKINTLAGKPLISDTGSSQLDNQLAGPIKITTGYRDTVIYPVATIN